MKSRSFVLFATLFVFAGCADDDDVCTDCSCDPSLCDGGGDADADGGDADADADGGPDDGDADAEFTDDSPAYPSVEGEWGLTYRNPTVGDESFTWNLTQTGETITGSGSDGCEYAGNITVDGVVHFFANGCGSTTTTQDGSLINPNHMEGNWESTSPWGNASGTWWADRR